ncbi:MAG: FAD-dependent oxidoreductase [Halobacteriota archaeon]
MRYEVVIFGGGATGTSTFRDLAMRGFSVALLERRTIASGTTSASHQNLLGGLRYVLSDPIVAQECAEENAIISAIAPEVVGELQNYFVGFSTEYAWGALRAAKKLHVKATELDLRDVFREIPSLNIDLAVAVETTDRNINAQRFCWLNCASAELCGGSLFQGTEVRAITQLNDGFRIKTNHGDLRTTYIINATGPWVNTVAAKLDTSIPVTYSQGTIIVQKALSPRGIQHLRQPSDADAYIVHDGYGWLGTTSTTINNPEEANPQPWADAYLKKEFAQILPGVKDQPTLSTFAGVRALADDNHPESAKNDSHFENGRRKSRDFRVIQAPKNAFHVIGGKLTTARLMAEKIADVICDKEARSARCQTAKEPLAP